MTLRNAVRCATFALLSAAPFAGAFAADDACARFKWDVSREVALYRSSPTRLDVAAAADAAPTIRTDTLYELRLQPQESLKFAVPPTKKQLADGANGGFLKLRVAEAGAYRVAIDSGFWLDVVSAGAPLATVDFNGSSECAGPRKIVVYDFPANADLLVQMSAATSPMARLTITRVGSAAAAK